MKVLETDDLVLLTDVLALETDIFFKLFPRHGILHFVTLFTEDSGLLKNGLKLVFGYLLRKTQGP